MTTAQQVVLRRDGKDHVFELVGGTKAIQDTTNKVVVFSGSVVREVELEVGQKAFTVSLPNPAGTADVTPVFSFFGEEQVHMTGVTVAADKVEVECRLTRVLKRSNISLRVNYILT